MSEQVSFFPPGSYVMHTVLLLLVLTISSPAKPPSKLPGEEITEEQYFDFVTPRDSIKSKLPQTSPLSKTWLDRAAKTWEAPPISVQLAKDTKKMRLGMGAVFIPYMSSADREPDIEIIDSTGEVIETGKIGQIYSFLPGTYYVLVGSGTHEQKIVKPVTIVENKKTPLIPDWCCLSIDVVDENNQPFRGEYEIARIDKFVPYGRGFGNDPDLGEKVKTWIFKPGIYKIFGVGESYNTLTNFITVRLLPGEFTRLTLVEKENSMEIIGGGTVQTKASSKITSNWKYGLDVGGSVDFNATYDHDDKLQNTNYKTISLIFRSQLNYNKGAIEWDSRLRLDEGITFEKWDLSRLTNTSDELRLTSIFTWRFFPWLGPYGRFETSAELFPEFERWAEDVTHFNFIVLDEDYYLTEIDSVDSSYRMEPSFSPFNFETGLGANINALNTRYFKARFLTGLGLKYKKIWDQSEKIDKTTKVYFKTPADEIAFNTITENESYTLIRRFNDKATTEVGPEVVLYMTLVLGRFATVESEVKYFAPFERMERPDFTLRSTISWHLIRMLTLDYEYLYMLKQPPEEALQQNESRHRILIRFSYASR